MATYSKAQDLIKSFESLRLTAYIDAVGVPTIGWGHTGPDVTMADVKARRTITQSQAQSLFDMDLLRFERAVDAAVRKPLTRTERGACISLAFNIGAGAFAGSTLVKRINANDFGGAADAFLSWNKGTVNGKKVVLNGLTRRRQAERALFLDKVG